MGGLDEDGKYLGIIGFASLIEMWQAAVFCNRSVRYGLYDSRGGCDGMYGWAVAAGTISCFFCILWTVGAIFIAALKGFTKFLAVFLAIWWTVALLTLTMPNHGNIGPFTVGCNAYFATWIAMLFSIALAAKLFGISDPSAMMPGGDGGGSGSSAGAPPKDDGTVAAV